MTSTCARCDQTVYLVEGLKCLDKVWHKGCFKCHECSMTLNMKNYKGFEKRPYCNAHCPQAKATTVADTPEIRRLAENTRNQSQAKYHEDFEKSKGKGFTTIVDDPEMLRIRNTSKIISNVAYHGELERKRQMEEQRFKSGDDESPNGNILAMRYKQQDHKQSHRLSEPKTNATHQHQQHHQVPLQQATAMMNNQHHQPKQQFQQQPMRKQPPPQQHQHSKNYTHHYNQKESPPSSNNKQSSPTNVISEQSPKLINNNIDVQKNLNNHHHYQQKNQQSQPKQHNPMQQNQQQQQQHQAMMHHQQHLLVQQHMPVDDVGALSRMMSNNLQLNQSVSASSALQQSQQQARTGRHQQSPQSQQVQQQQIAAMRLSRQYQQQQQQHQVGPQAFQQQIKYAPVGQIPSQPLPMPTHLVQVGPNGLIPISTIGGPHHMPPIGHMPLMYHPQLGHLPHVGPVPVSASTAGKQQQYLMHHVSAPHMMQANMPQMHQQQKQHNLGQQQQYQQQHQQQQQAMAKLVYRAMYDYAAQDNDEVSFYEGDILINCMNIDTGWMTGTVQRSGQTGMLPANYVEPVRLKG